MRLRLLGVLGGWLLSSAALPAAQSALIVVGTTGDPSIGADLSEVAQTVKEGLVQRGFASDAVEMLGAGDSGNTITREAMLASLKKRQNLDRADEFWLVLLGFSARNEEGAPAFQVKGPRLTAADLKKALDAIPARQFVLVGTSASGGFVPVLLQANRSVLSATRGDGEVDLPRYPEIWAQALRADPQAGWNEIADRAAAMTKQTYLNSNFALAEHPQLGDPASGKVLDAPFNLETPAAPAEPPSAGGGGMALVSASDIKIEIRKPNSEWERQPATPETKKLIEQAQATPNPGGYSSILLDQRLGYRVGADRAAEDFVMRRIYLAKEDGVIRWTNFLLPQDPPSVTTKLLAARIIQPDGSSTVFNPEKMPAATDCTSGVCGSLTMVFIPDARPGCVVEIAYRTHHLLDVGMPDFSEELPLQQDVPAVHTVLQLQMPPANGVHFKLHNSDAKPVDATVDGMRTLTWTFADLGAYEPLPYDPPARDLVVALDISSLDSWQTFATWTRRLMQGADAQDPSVREKAQDLAEGATTRLEKIRKAFEFVSALRYVAIEFGINGIRPRTPALVLQNRYGDCKDKANLLIALLADMGIEAKFSVLNRGSSTDVDFPSWQFNHAIAFVPKAPAAGQPDDLWLDTTDSTAPFPTLSPGDTGRAAFVYDGGSGSFHTVTEAGGDVTSLEERWDLAHQDGGNWTGTLEDTWSGQAECEMRGRVRGLSPRQRDFVLESALARQLVNADFDHPNMTAADDLTVPLKMETQVTAPSVPNPLPAFDVNAYFAPTERDHPILLNNGQKLHLVQTVNLDWAKTAAPGRTDPAPFDQKVAGIHARIVWKGGAGVVQRTAELTVDQPLVAAADYSSVRSMLRNWVNQLSN